MRNGLNRWLIRGIVAGVLLGGALAVASCSGLPRIGGLPSIPGLPFGGTPTPAANAAPATAVATRGDMAVSVSGTGTLAPGSEINLAFGSGGTVAEVDVQVGDKVQSGQVLAKLDDTALRNQVVQAGIAVRKAQLALQTTTTPPTTDQIAAAQSTVAAAQSDLDTLTKPADAASIAAARSNLTSAQQALDQLLAGPSTDQKATLEADLRTAQVTLQQAQSAYNQVAWQPNVGMSQQATALQNATIAYDKAKAQYNIGTAAPTESDVAAARAKVASAQSSLTTLTQGPDAQQLAAAKAKLAAAQAQLQQLLAGPTTATVQTAQLAVQQAQTDLASSMLALQNLTIRAPVTGTVTAVNIAKGSQFGTGTAIALADQTNAQLQFWLEELDSSKVHVGDPVQVVFQAYPGLTYDGKIARIEPKMVTVDNAPAAQLWATLDFNQHPVNLLYGMSADVRVVAGQAKNAVLVPLAALRELSPGVFAVFVLQPDGQLALRPVQVGLRDFANAEIKSGLQGGEQVSIGNAQQGQNRTQGQAGQGTGQGSGQRPGQGTGAQGGGQGGAQGGGRQP